MTRDFPNLPQADNQPISQQPLILRGNPEHLQNPFLDAQPATLNALPQFPDMQHPYPDMQQTFAQQAFPDAQHLLPDPQQPLLDLDMQQTFAQQAFPDAQHLLPDPQQPLLDLDMQQTFTQQALPDALQFFPDSQDPLLAPDMQQTFAQQPIPDAYPFAQVHQSQFGHAYNGPLRPDYLLHHQPYSSPISPFAKLAHLWRSDPAYKVFFLAGDRTYLGSCLSGYHQQYGQGAFIVTGISPSNNGNGHNTSEYPHTDAYPYTNAYPYTHDGANNSSVPPPPLQLTVGITSIPSAVVNNTTTSIGVTTNEPGVTVALYVTYSGATPSTFKGTARTTDSNGQITLPWHVSIHSSKRLSNVTAHVTVYAQDTNGQNATSQTVTVQVFTFQTG